MTDKETLDILYLFASNQARGGVKIQIEHCNRFAALGHRVQAFSPVSKPDWIDLEFSWRVVEEKPFGKSLPACDLIIFGFCEQAFIVASTAIAGGALPIYFVQGDELLFANPEEAPDETMQTLVEATHASLKLPYPILTVSNETARRITELGGARPTVIPNGIDWQLFKPANVENDPPRVLCVGDELARFKGVTEVLGAMMILWREGLRFQFVRASPNPNQIEDMEFPVEFHERPSQKELAELYAGADLFVGASHVESFYLPPLEAMSSGTAVVCSDLPAVREYALPGDDFLAFPPGDVPAMARQIRRALRYPKLRRKLRERGLEVAARMDWQVIIPRLEKYFREQLDRKEKIREALRKERDRPTLPWRLWKPGDEPAVE